MIRETSLYSPLSIHQDYYYLIVLTISPTTISLYFRRCLISSAYQYFVHGHLLILIQYFLQNCLLLLNPSLPTYTPHQFRLHRLLISTAPTPHTQYI